MTSLAPRARRTLKDLEAVLASATIPPRIARTCRRLVEKLRQPIRVGLIGYETEQRKRLLAALLGIEVLPDHMGWPTIEIGFCEEPHTKATLADGSRLAAKGMPTAELLDQGAVFLQVGAPLDALRRVTLLHLATGDDAGEQLAALRWAARRIDFAVWCTRDFSPEEAQIWNAAPPELKNHAYLVTFAADTEARRLRERMLPDFERVMVLPDGHATGQPGAADIQAGAQNLFAQLSADIDDALGEDLDAAWVLLQRCGREIETPQPAAVPVEAEGSETLAMETMVDLLSEPLIFLKRWARDLFETLEWQDADSPDWPGAVLERCCEVTDGLRDRAAEWPEDAGQVLALRGLVDDASDMATLLQIEGGREQAQDAAALLLQLRSAFEANLAGPATLVN
jgi:nitroreductase